MQALTPITPLEAGVEMFQKGNIRSMFPTPEPFKRPVSQVTEFFDTDDERSDIDDSPIDDFEKFESRRSRSTISTIDEVPTPHSSRQGSLSLQMEMKSVEGPRGPHLFRSSLSSAEVDFDYALQMSPLLPKQPPPRVESVETAFRSPATVLPRNQPFSPSFAAAAGFDASEVRAWSATQVATWMYNLGVEEFVVEKFEDHDITGAVLLDLKFEDLKELEIQSFGKRHQLWNHIENLRGGDGRISPAPTPFQDTDKPCSEQVRSKSKSGRRDRSLRRLQGESSDSQNDGTTTPGGGKRRRRKHRGNGDDPITPAESVSIVAIEQLLPKPHKCAKGERCGKWRKQQKLLAKLREEHGLPISPEKGGQIFVAGDPGNANTAPNIVENVHRPTSEAVPSVVASSDLLGPGDAPAFSLQEDLLRSLESRDAQENVKQFLAFQHMEPPHSTMSPIERPSTPPLEMFPPQHHQQHPALQPHTLQSQGVQAPISALKSLPKLAIPRSCSAGPGPATYTAIDSAFSPCPGTAISPGTAHPDGVYRFGTPASEMDVPLTAIPSGPVARDASQSVPPSMHYRDPVSRSNSRAADWRRPSFAMPRLTEDEVVDTIPPTAVQSRVTSPTRNRASDDSTVLSVAEKPRIPSRGFDYGDATHHGWMKKRKTRLLRHEWHDHHARLAGTQLSMHPNALPTSVPHDTIDIHEYAVACSSIASNNKLAAKLKAFKISEGEKKKEEAFQFQLVPALRSREEGEPSVLKKSVAGGKTHHFAVKTRDERIDWMRELMLAKALKAKGEGYEIKVNGTAI